ncbi:hypothetical protein [uncultured Acetobacterium sp.]|jgi:hypothetical protein|uniref:hypothetical protein n=1 Tax=uncultured Acetobacterium sp. TaxID=217139 RepID=UPI002425166A|nr:hypothetical protein [uncultured Acetobacterium sp.]MBU4541570.1 hypothetical protein [Bacillota bacterium]MDP2842236.1 hypothetical protein [Acetobacterium sp.]
MSINVEQNNQTLMCQKEWGAELMESTKSNACSYLECGFNVSGKCPDMDVLKNPYKETGCIFYKNKNIQTDGNKSE